MQRLRPTVRRLFSLGAVAAALTWALASVQAAHAADDAPAAARERNPDPWEPMNRGIFRFNDTLDRNLLRPVAVVYAEHTPRWLQTGVSNFFVNLFYPTTIVNQFLQGKFKQGGQDILRFTINSTLGWGGVLDVASGANLPVHNEDSGQTLGRWGVPPGPYLMIPLIGPATVRDAPARYADTFAQPFRWYNADSERWFSLALSLVDTRAQLLPLDRTIREAYDPYVFVRDAFLARRLYLVHDGNPPQAASDENWAEEALREDEAEGAVDTDATSAAPAATEPQAPQPPPEAAPASPPTQ
jgi:phospholipid-binding lipoprotein MlaA